MKFLSTINYLAASSCLLICISCSAQPTQSTPKPQITENIQPDQVKQKIAYNIETGEVQPENLHPKDEIINLKTGETIKLKPNITEELQKKLANEVTKNSNFDSDFPKYGATLISVLNNSGENDMSVIVTPSENLSSKQNKKLMSLFKNVNKQKNANNEVWYVETDQATLIKIADSPLISKISLQPRVSLPSLPPTSNTDTSSQINTTAEDSLNSNPAKLDVLPAINSKLNQTLELLNQLDKKSPNQNIAFSTFSLDQAAKAALLAMPKPLTAKRPSWMLSGLTEQSLSEPTVPITEGYKNLNQVFYRQGDTLTKPFQTAYTTTLAGKTQSLDFSKANAASIQANQWLKENTNGMIDTMFKPDMFQKNEAILSNVLYFKANWLSPFTVEKTKSLPFTTATGKTQTVPTMIQEFEVYHAKDKGWEYVGMPFADGSMLQLFVTPEDKSNAIPDSETLTELLQSSTEKKVELLLPKLNLQGDTLALNEIAPEIGSWKLPNLIEGKLLKNPQMVHKSVITWDEKGAEAAAASMMMVSKGISLTPTVTVDRPFVFMIRQGDEVMFTGAVRDMQAVSIKETEPTSQRSKK